ncbi:1-aminocyclopropane-1-carboxylate oxidase [Fonsecaea pedrosoi]|nr:1-aminocyclopropane-1-carboxylate oxidase [Fonsecaea pedrosoi]
MGSLQEPLLGETLLQTAKRLEAADFKEVPVIDLAGLSSEEITDRIAVAREVRDACIRVGFFYVKNHGVPQEVIDRAFEVSKKFFSLPAEDKMEVYVTKNESFKGYEDIHYGAVDPQTKGDMKEAFNFGYEPAADPQTPLSEPWPLYEGLKGPNVWPRNFPEQWKQDLFAYYGEVLNLGRRMIRAFALVLDLPEDYFDDLLVRPGAIMRLLRYPASILDPDHPGIGAHRDYECFTILCQDETNGLQVQTKKGEWIEVTPIPGTFVVNIGDFLSRWTNDVFRSTLHRVYNVSGRERYSFPLFIGPNYTTKIQAIHTCVNEDRPAKHEPFVAGEYISNRLYGAKRKPLPTPLESSA